MICPATQNTATALKMQTECLDKIYQVILSKCTELAANGLFKNSFFFNKKTQEFLDKSSWPYTRYHLSYQMLDLLKEKLEADGYRVWLKHCPVYKTDTVRFKVSWKPSEFVEVHEVAEVNVE